MGQAVGSLLGYKREDKTVPEGVESHFTVVDRTVFKRRLRLEFTILYPNDKSEAEEAEDDAVAVDGEEEKAAFASRAVIEEVSSQCSVVALEEEEEAEAAAAAGAAGADDDMPPLAFVGEDEEDGGATASTRRPGPVRRAHSTGTAPTTTASTISTLKQAQQQGRPPQHPRRPPRPQSVGALTAPGSSGRLSLHGVTEAVSVGGREMNRLRLSLVSRRSRGASVGGDEASDGAADEQDEEMVVLGSTSLLLPPAVGAAAAEEKGQRRCESVTVSLEAVGGGGKEGEMKGQGGEAEGEAALNVEIEQAEGFKPIQQLSEEQAAGVPFVQKPLELHAAVQRLCQSYARDEHSPSVVANKRDVRIITAYLLQLIAPAPPALAAVDAADGAELGPDSSHSSLPTLPLPTTSPTPSATAATTTDSAAGGEAEAEAGPTPDAEARHTPIPPPPASPFGAEPIIETNAPSRGASQPATTTDVITTPAAPVPPPKPVRKQRRKIRLSASQVELLEAAGDGAGTADAGAEAVAVVVPTMAAAAAGAEVLFDDLWAVDEPSPSPKPKAKPEKAAKKKLLAPEGAGAIPDHEMSMWA